jgi:YD repeat-containing protein
VTHSYGYDSVQRLVSWYDGTDTTKYTYDQVGNRTLLTGTTGVVPIASYYTSAGPNQLTQTVEIKAGGIVTNYGYDANGAVTGIRRWNTTGPVSSDSLVYSYRGLTEGFLHDEYSGASVKATSEWRYRYSAGGEREQKRLYLQQDSLHNVIEHNSWVYYALGGKKEQLAVYHGQEMAVPDCLPPGKVASASIEVES